VLKNKKAKRNDDFSQVVVPSETNTFNTSNQKQNFPKEAPPSLASGGVFLIMKHYLRGPIGQANGNPPAMVSHCAGL